jgi:hypothetical protein
MYHILVAAQAILVILSPSAIVFLETIFVIQWSATCKVAAWTLVASLNLSCQLGHQHVYFGQPEQKSSIHQFHHTYIVKAFLYLSYFQRCSTAGLSIQAAVFLTVH